MPDCFDRFRIAWSDYQKADVPILVAVSGGADSVALVRLLRKFHSPTPQATIAHFNHRWRGADSDADAEFVRELANQLRWECEIGVAESNDRTEESARDERYRYLTQVAQKRGARYLAVAHTADDQVETILHHVLRGTGLEGLAGMPRQRVLSPAVTLVRPLLDFRRQELLVYLAEIGQSYRKDPTNADTKYTRSRIRHDLLPILRKDYNKQVDVALIRLGQIARDSLMALKPIQDQLTGRAVEFSNESVAINARELAGQPEFLITMVLNKVWQRQGWPRRSMGYSDWHKIIAILQLQSGTIMLPGGITATRQNAQLILRR